MLKVIRTAEYSEWLIALKDKVGKAKIISRVDRLILGHPGDARPIGGGLSELRIHWGPGYRVYFAQHGNVCILLLIGGDKSTQRRDIRRAQQIYSAYEE